jgi:hypothetical protein
MSRESDGSIYSEREPESMLKLGLLNNTEVTSASEDPFARKKSYLKSSTRSKAAETFRKSLFDT